jgi:hypothetical protein
MSERELTATEQTEQTAEQKRIEIEQKLVVAKAALEALDAETKDKQYAIKIGDSLDTLLKFIDEEANWKFTEALGVQQVHKKLTSCKRDGLKNGCIFVGALEVDAIHYFMSKAEGKGLEKAERFLSILKPMNDAIKLVTADRKEMEKLTQQVAAYSEGIDLAEEPVAETTEKESESDGQE